MENKWIVQADMSILEDVSCKAAILYFLLIEYTRTDTTCFPSRETLRNRMKVKLSTIDRLKRELRAAGYITWVSRKKKGSREQQNTYSLPKYKLMDGRRVKTGPTVESKGDQPQSQNGTGNNTQYKNTHISSSTTTVKENTVGRLEEDNHGSGHLDTTVEGRNSQIFYKKDPLYKKVSIEQQTFIDKYEKVWTERNRDKDFTLKYSDIQRLGLIKDFNDATKMIPILWSLDEKYIKSSDYSITMFYKEYNDGKLNNLYIGSKQYYLDKQNGDTKKGARRLPRSI